MSFFKIEKYNNEASIPQFLNPKTKNIFPWYYTNIDLFIGTLHYHTGNLEKAYEVFTKFVEHLKIRPYRNKMEIAFHKCMRDYMGTLIDGSNRDEAINSLKEFYPINIINGVINDIGDSELVLNRYGQLNCWNCNECQLKEHCLNHQTEGFYKTLKERYASNPIDQRDLKNILNL